MKSERQPSTLCLIRANIPHINPKIPVQDAPRPIALAPGDDEDGLLTAAKIIEELDLNAELVVLSGL